MESTDYSCLESPKNLHCFPEWLNYCKNPSQTSLKKLLISTNKCIKIHELVAGLVHLNCELDNWKVSQHIAILLMKENSIALSFHYANRALIDSNGDIRARLVFTKLLWKRRLPYAISFQEPILLKDVRRIKQKSYRKWMRCEIYELLLCNYSYLLDLKKINYYYHCISKERHSISFETAVKILQASHHINIRYLYIKMANYLAPAFPQLGSRLQNVVKKGVRIGFTNLLRGRMHVNS